MNFPDSDDLDALFTATGPAASPAGRTPPASYKPAFTEKCAKCNGTGKFITPRGHVFGKCFACDGAGSKTFATSRGTRVKAKAQREARQDAERVENATAFKDENPNEWAWMLATAPRWQLIQSFLEAITKWGSLTDRQLEVVRNGMLRDADRAAAKVTAAPAVEAAGVDRLKAAFDTAAAVCDDDLHHYHPNFSAQIGPMPRSRHSERSVALQTQQMPVSWPYTLAACAGSGFETKATTSAFCLSVQVATAKKRPSTILPR